MPGFNIESGKDSNSAHIGGSDLNRASRWRIKSLVFGSGTDYSNVLNDRGLLFAKSLTLPTYSVEEESVLGGSINYKVAKTVTWDDVKVTFYDLAHKNDVNKSILGQLYKARQKLWTPDKGLHQASDYKGESTFILTDGDGNPTWSFTLVNSYIKSINHSELSYETSSIKEVTLTISYDWAIEGDDSSVGNDDRVKEYNFLTKPLERARSEEELLNNLNNRPRFSKGPLGKSVSKDDIPPSKNSPTSPAKERAEKAKAELEARHAKERASKAALNTQIAVADATFRSRNR